MRVVLILHCAPRHTATLHPAPCPRRRAPQTASLGLSPSSSQLGVTNGRARRRPEVGGLVIPAPPWLAWALAVAALPMATAPAVTGLARDQEHCPSSCHFSVLRCFIILCQVLSPFTSANSVIIKLSSLNEHIERAVSSLPGPWLSRGPSWWLGCSSALLGTPGEL